MLINNNSSVMIFHLLVFNKIFFYSIRNSIGNSYFDINQFHLHHWLPGIVTFLFSFISNELGLLNAIP